MLTRLGRWLGRRAPPRGQEVDEFLRVARESFVGLQAAWDAADLKTLAACTTERLAAELREELERRGPGPNRTEVVAVDARLLALEELNEAFLASVEFSGLIRERLDDDGAAPFRELWLLAKPKVGSTPGWRLARVQALG